MALVNTTDSPGSRRIFSTHMAHQLLVRNLNSSECRVVYVTRNPKDTLVSMFHFAESLTTLKNLFTTYEDLKADPDDFRSKKMAEFWDVHLEEKMGQRGGRVPYNSFFRKGEVGDHMNFLDDEKIALIDEITRIKFHGSGFNYGI
ncbi:hypothetical protein Leryth_015899 [Lithospermum erythrorhizon]|nr:hypothetical protein Leryth_015899 [Lithospermum erythrorhizon]